MAIELPNEFFTLQSMLTLTGATGTVYLVCNTVQQVAGTNPKWLALLVSQALALTGVHLIGGSGLDWFVGVVNGCLIFCTAAGASGISGVGPTGGVARGVDSGVKDLTRTDSNRRGFFSSWF